MANKTISASTTAAINLTPDAENTAASLRPQPRFVALGLLFSCVIGNETTPVLPFYMTEPLGFLFPAEVKEEQQIQAMETALRAGGAILPSIGLAKSWRTINVGSRLCETAMPQIGSGGGSIWTLDSTESGGELFAERASSIGAHVAKMCGVASWRRVGGVTGWRRFDEVKGPHSAMQRLKLCFEELEALNDARELGASIARPVASVKPRSL